MSKGLLYEQLKEVCTNSILQAMCPSLNKICLTTYVRRSCLSGTVNCSDEDDKNYVDCRTDSRY